MSGMSEEVDRRGVPSPPPVGMTLEERMLHRNEAIWGKLLGMEEQVIKMQSEMAQMKVQTQLYTGTMSVDTGGEAVKELSARVDYLDDMLSHQTRVQAEFKAAQSRVGQQVEDAIAEAVNHIHAESRAVPEDLKEELKSELYNAIQMQIQKSAGMKEEVSRRVAVVENALKESSGALDGKILRLRDKVGEVENALRENALKETAELPDLILRLSDRVDEVTKETAFQTAQLARCDMVCEWFEEESGLKNFGQAFRDLKDLVVDQLSPMVPQHEAELKKVAQQHESLEQHVRDLEESTRISDIEESLRELVTANVWNIDASVQRLAADMQASRDALGKLDDKVRVNEALGQDTSRVLDDLKRKDLQRGEQLKILEVEKLPNLGSRIAQLESSTRLEDIVRDLRNDVDKATSHVQRSFDSKLGDRLREERLQTSADCAEVAQRWHDEARPRFDSLEAAVANWRGAFDQRQAELTGQFMSQEQRYSLQDRRLFSHDADIKRLEVRCEEIPRLLEARVDEVRAAIKDDLTATSLAAFQGEMALMAKIAQLSNISGASPGVQPHVHLAPLVAQPGTVFDGRGIHLGASTQGQLIAGLPRGSAA